MSSSDKPGLQLFVARLTARSVLNDEEKQAILDLPTKEVFVRAKQGFVPIDEETTYSCMIVSGLVARVGETVEGKRQITAFHIPGDMADLHSAVRPVGIGGLTALTDTVILRVPHVSIRAVAARYPAIAEAFWRDSVLDAAVLMQWVINVGRRSARTRLAHFLCEMAVRYGTDQKPLLTFDFPISQEQLADAAGLTSVHVNRSLRALALEGVVTKKAKAVHIREWNELAKVGEFSPAYLEADTAPQRRKRLLTEI